MNITAIKPTVRGKSDFFSWQLYRWCLKKPSQCQIWLGTWNSVTGHDRDNPVFYIGAMDSAANEQWFHGTKLKSLCLHGAKLDGWAYGPAHDVANWQDVTEQWWADYMKKGVCHIHGDYAHEWNVSGDSRSCQYCGKKETKKTKLIQKEYWS